MGIDVQLAELARLFLGAESIALLTHVEPDGDTFGSCTALAFSLRKLNKKVAVIIEDEIPRAYNFIDVSSEPKTLNSDEYDLIAAIDSGSLDRLGKRASEFQKCNLTVNIDHHITNTHFAHYNFVDTKASSTAEIIFNLLKTMDLKIDRYAATCLYLGIVTDTGGFRYSNTTPEIHKVAAELIEYGMIIELSELNWIIFDRSTLSKTKLTGKVISNIKLFLGGRIAISVIDQKDMTEAEATDEDCEGMVNIGRNLEGVEVSAFARFREDGNVKVNLRSNSFFDVSKIAAIYNGGGHAKAAGFTIIVEPENFRSFMDDVVRHIEEGMKS